MTVLIPDHETAVDFLNYEAIAKTVVAILNSTGTAASLYALVAPVSDPPA